MNILFYYPSNKRTVSIETLIIGLKKRKFNVILLTTCEKGDFHWQLEREEIQTFGYQLEKNISPIFYLKHVLYLIKFCKRKNIDFVFSHLQGVNIISVVAQFFTKAKFIIFRHHFKFYKPQGNIRESLPRNQNEIRGDILINKLAKKIIVPSSGVYNSMLQHENVKRDKLKIIPYIYDFSKYHKPKDEHVSHIRRHYSCRLLLLMCSRLIPFKRHRMVFDIVNKLFKEGLDLKMLVLDEGPEREFLENFINNNRLEECIIMLGFRRDFINYMAASDLLLHPSLTEASNSVVKEMGLLGKAVAVCEGVGDFDDYIIHKKNGFLMSSENTKEHMEKIIRNAYGDPGILGSLGKQLKIDVLERFNRSERVMKMYEEILTE